MSVMTEEETSSPDTASLEELYAQSLRGITEGEIVKGRIIDITAKDVVVDISYKSEGAIPRYEFGNQEGVEVGAEVDVLVESIEDEHGMVVLSKHKADRQRGWERIVNHFKEGDVMDGRVDRHMDELDRDQLARVDDVQGGRPLVDLQAGLLGDQLQGGPPREVLRPPETDGW